MLRRCNVCQSASLTTVWELPDFPLTGIYVSDPIKYDFVNHFDQHLLFCKSCSHSQLSSPIDAKFLYQDSYTHRTSESSISAKGNQFFLNFVYESVSKSTFNQVLEIGCNDLYLLDNLDFKALNRSGLDPIWPDGISVSQSGIRLSGGFAESANYSQLINEKIDLVLSAHTFEHIIEPIKVLERLEPFLADKCDLIIEVPSLERTLQQRRMDQVFHQHVNYYTVNSLQHLFSGVGFKLISLRYNYFYWGGTQLLHFAKGREEEIFDMSYSKISEETLRLSIYDFEKLMSACHNQILELPGKAVGFGAAQMLPVLNYHLKGLLASNVERIVDDNQQRQGKFFPGISTPISSLDSIQDYESANIIITALDSTRSIIKRIHHLSPRSILVPIGFLN